MRAELAGLMGESVSARLDVLIELIRATERVAGVHALQVAELGCALVAVILGHRIPACISNPLSREQALVSTRFSSSSSAPQSYRQ